MVGVFCLVCGFFDASLGKLILTTDNPDCWEIAGFTEAFDEDLEASELKEVDEPDTNE